MVYRILALDIDGTLLKNNHRLDRSTKEAVAFAKEKGAIVTLVTERHFHSAAKVAKALKLTHPIVTHNGAFISTTIDDPIHTNKISHDVLLQLVEFLETYNCRIRFAHERLSVSNRPRQKNLIAKMTVGVSEPLFYPVTYVNSLSGYLRENGDDAAEVEVELYNDNMEEVLQAMEDFFPSLQVRKEDATTLVLTNHGATKWGGLSYLCHRLGIPVHQVVTVGDDANDLEMIEKAGLGVAMQNAPKEVRAKADWITRSNDMNGVAYVVREVFRKQMKTYV
ncbi:Cof-type HAD-IIB family hydrolase [Pullulanibacillus sp. KACC 23026]|uniref:Cof-type HAD-IIB family hydrolase n=1 Tax=Pullulanibacillus sp. KACC 23026 TaxID=3028315 RepID=UPI0023AECB2B|nr:Cof-type HAD-IIB family hydrolase [Pullulanibacillus sp. KACC 23026]WEG12047.1 Cof-type HAD-IIB family hydrolase [Pullulanibacillus sp. KACC 23026]